MHTFLTLQRLRTNSVPELPVPSPAVVRPASPARGVPALAQPSRVRGAGCVPVRWVAQVASAQPRQHALASALETRQVCSWKQRLGREWWLCPADTLSAGLPTHPADHLHRPYAPGMHQATHTCRQTHPIRLPLTCSMRRLRFWSSACRAWRPASLQTRGELQGVCLPAPPQIQPDISGAWPLPAWAPPCSLPPRRSLTRCTHTAGGRHEAQAFKLALAVHEAVRGLATALACLPPALMLHACCCSPPQPAPVYTVRQVLEYAPVTFDLVATMDSILQESVAREVGIRSGLPASAGAAMPE